VSPVSTRLMIKGCWILLKPFSASYKMIMCFFCVSVCLKSGFIYFCLLNHPCNTGINLLDHGG
jgi:Pyruvate/2-oxoacid:ferredoxin oxidoreductase delta subunit